MSRESILKIKEAEENAARMVADATEQAQLMVEQARQNGEALCQQAEKEADEEMRQMLDGIKARTEATARRFATDAEAEAEEMKRMSRLHQKVAEKIIIRGLDAKCR